MGYHSYGHLARTDDEARERMYRPWLEQSRRIGAERGWGRMDRSHFEQEADHGAMVVGSPDTAARRIAAGVRSLGASRFQLKISTGHLGHEALMETIHLYATEVVPLVKDMLSDD
ncbi:hypothetical protein [Tessaracoccus coleopterorum]|uniref:hypothetical protein n=1 Tax=Tessaracoccus coleopterorum TaxID=2714950 RepID=UPI001E5D61F2|nr:hypothetical protein [Tessaracoccus coleopterorum]